MRQTLSSQTVSLLLLFSAISIHAQPVVSAAVNGASFDGALTPGALVSIFGRDFATNTEVASTPPLPYTLKGTSVVIGGIDAPLYFVSPGQINLQVPFEVSLGTVPLIVRGPTGASAPYSVTMRHAALAIFSTASNGKGRGIMFDRAFRAPESLNPGDSIIMYAVGLGATNPQAQSGNGGSDSEPFNRVASVPDLYIGDSKAQVLFAGLAPGLVGVYQVNALVPENLQTDRIFFKLGDTQSNVVSFARSYPGTETIYLSSGPAVGTTVDFDSGIPAGVRGTVQNAVALAVKYYTSSGLGDPGTAHLFVSSSLDTLSNIYAQWNLTPVEVARSALSGNDAISGPGVTFYSAFRTDWAQSPAPLQEKIVAHECFHILQTKLDPQGIGVPNDQVPLMGPRWLIEGSAEYMGYATVSSSGLLDFSATLAQETDQARRTAVLLRSLETLPGIQAAGPDGGLALMFMAIDFLTTKSGAATLGTFWTVIGQGAKWPDAFQSAFGRTIDQFYADFESYRNVNLRPYPQIIGTVTNAASNPFPGISVYACAVKPPGPCGYGLTDAGGHYAIRSPDAGYTLSFGRSSDGNKPDGFYSSQGLVTDPTKATVVTVRGGDVSGIDVRLPF